MRRAFTLIELLVVIVIIAILMAVAIPTFLNQRHKAQDTAAKNNATILMKDLRSALVDDTSQYTYNQSPLNSDPSIAAFVLATEPELTTPPLAGGSVFATVANNPPAPAQTLTAGACALTTLADATGKYDIAEIACRSKSGIFWVIYDSPNSGPPLKYEYPAKEPSFVATDPGYLPPLATNW